MMGNNKVIKIIVIIFVIVFFVHQIYSSLFKPIVTECADYFEYTDGTELAVYIIRNEKQKLFIKDFLLSILLNLYNRHCVENFLSI